MEEFEVLPEAGLISLKMLAKYLDTTDVTLIEGLNKYKVPYVKLSKYHKHWMIRLQDLKPTFKEDISMDDVVESKEKITEK